MNRSGGKKGDASHPWHGGATTALCRHGNATHTPKRYCWGGCASGRLQEREWWLSNAVRFDAIYLYATRYLLGASPVTGIRAGTIPAGYHNSKAIPSCQTKHAVAYEKPRRRPQVLSRITAGQDFVVAAPPEQLLPHLWFIPFPFQIRWRPGWVLTEFQNFIKRHRNGPAAEEAPGADALCQWLRQPPPHPRSPGVPAS